MTKTCLITHAMFPALDISTDLSELGRTPVAVVCAGVKSILDIGRTLEVLVRSLVPRRVRSLVPRRVIASFPDWCVASFPDW